MKPNFISFPENTSEVVDEGTDKVYNCTVASSNRTEVRWVFEGAAIPDCIHNLFDPPCNNCRTDNKPYACVTRDVSVTEELFLVHSLLLHIYNLSTIYSGQYTCKVQGIDEKVVRRNSLIIQKSIRVSINNSKVNEIDETGTSVVSNKRNDKIIISLVSAFASVLIFVMSIFMVIVVVKLFCYINNPRGNREALNSMQEIEQTSTITMKKIEEDGWEFPREKLKFLQKIGEAIIHLQWV